MNTDILEVRRTYEHLRKSNTHLLQSSEIATACVCQNLFKLDYPYGAITSDKDYLSYFGIKKDGDTGDTPPPETPPEKTAVIRNNSSATKIYGQEVG